MVNDVRFNSRILHGRGLCFRRVSGRRVPFVLAGLLAPLLAAAGCGTGLNVAVPTAVPTQITLPGGDVEVPAVIVSNHIFVDVTINGAGPYKVLLDTGAALGQISPTVADQFPDNLLNTSTVLVGPLGGTAPVPLFRVDSLMIGTVEFKNFSVGVQDVSATFPTTPFTVQGIMGSGLFRALALTLNYPAQKVRMQNGVLPATDNCTILPISGADLDAGGTYLLPQLSISVVGQSVSAYLDSGNNGILLLPESYAGLPFVAPPAHVTGQTQNGATPFLQGDLNGNVSYGCISMTDPTILVGGSLASLGAGGWQTLVVTIDQASKRVRFVRP